MDCKRNSVLRHYFNKHVVEHLLYVIFFNDVKINLERNILFQNTIIICLGSQRHFDELFWNVINVKEDLSQNVTTFVVFCRLWTTFCYFDNKFDSVIGFNRQLPQYTINTVNMSLKRRRLCNKFLKNSSLENQRKFQMAQTESSRGTERVNEFSNEFHRSTSRSHSATVQSDLDV